MTGSQQQVLRSVKYERALETLRLMLETAIARAERGEAQAPDVASLKRRLRRTLARQAR
jgi:hypothetical protein